MRVNSSNELFYVLDGHGTLALPDREIEISPRSIYVFPAKQVYHFACDQKLEYYCIGFGGSSPAEPLVCFDNESTDIRHLIQRLEYEFFQKLPRRQEIMDNIISSVLIIVQRMGGIAALRAESKEAEDNFPYIINYLNERSPDGVDMEQVAAMSGLSYHRFRHRFKEIFGISPQQFVIRRRISFAKELLETTAFPTASIALASGFRSVPQFITCFSKQEGITPVKYRRSLTAGKC